MNNNSVVQEEVQNQQQLSWRLDPFNLGTEPMKVVKKTMSNQERLTSFAEELVTNYAFLVDHFYELPLHMLSEYDQNELVRLYIESIDREIEWACYGSDQSIESSFMCSLLAMLQDDGPITRNEFAITTRKNMIIYYSDILQELLNDACNSYTQFVNDEQGRYANTDPETGEIYWGIF